MMIIDNIDSAESSKENFYNLKYAYQSYEYDTYETYFCEMKLTWLLWSIYIQDILMNSSMPGYKHMLMEVIKV